MIFLIYIIDSQLFYIYFCVFRLEEALTMEYFMPTVGCIQPLTSPCISKAPVPNANTTGHRFTIHTTRYLSHVYRQVRMAISIPGISPVISLDQTKIYHVDSESEYHFRPPKINFGIQWCMGLAEKNGRRKNSRQAHAFR